MCLESGILAAWGQEVCVGRLPLSWFHFSNLLHVNAYQVVNGDISDNELLSPHSLPVIPLFSAESNGQIDNHKSLAKRAKRDLIDIEDGAPSTDCVDQQYLRSVLYVLFVDGRPDIAGVTQGLEVMILPQFQ